MHAAATCGPARTLTGGSQAGASEEASDFWSKTRSCFGRRGEVTLPCVRIAGGPIVIAWSFVLGLLIIARSGAVICDDISPPPAPTTLARFWGAHSLPNQGLFVFAS